MKCKSQYGKLIAKHVTLAWMFYVVLKRLMVTGRLIWILSRIPRGIWKEWEQIKLVPGAVQDQIQYKSGCRYHNKYISFIFEPWKNSAHIPTSNGGHKGNSAKYNFNMHEDINSGFLYQENALTRQTFWDKLLQ